MKATLARWVESLGMPGVLGIGVLCLCATFYAGTIRPGEARLAILQKEIQRLDRMPSRAPSQADGASLESKLGDFYEDLASQPSASEQIEAIVGIARRNDITLRQGSYQFSRQGGQFARYEVVFTGRAPYYRARIFMHEVLHELPMVSLDEVSFQRPETSTGAVDMTARFSLFEKSER